MNGVVDQSLFISFFLEWGSRRGGEMSNHTFRVGFKGRETKGKGAYQSVTGTVFDKVTDTVSETVGI